MTTYNSFWQAAPFVLGTAALLGGGARVTKGLVDVFRRSDPESSPVNIEKTEDPIVGVEVPVSHEEAEELRRKGVKVKKHASSFADDMDVGPWNAFALGALGTGAAIGGWKVTNALIEKYRKSQTDAKRESIRNRIKALLNDIPEDEDLLLHAQMKAAEAVRFPKEAIFNLETQVMNPLAALLGGGLMLSGIRAYNQSVVAGEEPGKIKALSRYLKRMKVKPPLATIVPVEEEAPAGSPAEQAASNQAA